MTIPMQLASLYNGQEVFVWSDGVLDLGMDLTRLDFTQLRFSSIFTSSASLLVEWRMKKSRVKNF